MSKRSSLADLPPILDAREVAEVLRLNRKGVYAAARTGRIPCQRVGKVLRFSRDALIDWFRSEETVRR